ncbi:MAG: SMC domain protein [uncultured Sulfurovum sp.]|uniref:SMC domain protein n=1 Tax=uncultured Sulfurovum sp. TaxID=269237 RepID=A0A6S6TA96_9BACT|nr:MAG: SMC domain protein [uncultured Sulfurovum sp.]
MAINKDEIEKYIFDPENPKQCKSYNLLLKIAKKENEIFISRHFFCEFFISKEVVSKIDNDLWDKSNSYQSMSKYEKVNLYINQFSKNDLLDLLIENSKYLNFTQYFFLKNIILFRFATDIDNNLSVYENLNNTMNMKNSYIDVLEPKLIDLEKNFIDLFKSYNTEKSYEILIGTHFYNKNKIIFYDFDDFNILKLKRFERSSILITTLRCQDMFFRDSISSNIKPIFLKKIEDVDILLNVLEQDLKKEKQKNIPQEKISILDEVSIENFFSINEIKLNNLKDKKEIYIVGENGDGKSLLLQSIAIALAGVKEGDVFDLVKSQLDYTLSVIDSEKQEYTQNSEKPYNNILAYGASRNNYCQMKEDVSGYLTLFKGEYDLKSPIKWLQYLDYSEQSEKVNVITVAEAKKLLQHLLNSDIQIDISPDKVTFTEKGSEVSFNQLSAGYKGVTTIICDLIARLSEKQQVEKIADFQGVVLIDEVELHLHPKWQYSFMNKLRETFPLIQFMVTTHSPTVLLGAGMEAVFYKVYKENGETKLSHPMDSIKNLMANNLSTSPLFDMETARARNSDDNIDTSEDFIYTKIHERIAERVKGKKAILEDDIVEMINKELDDYLKDND